MPIPCRQLGCLKKVVKRGMFCGRHAKLNPDDQEHKELAEAVGTFSRRLRAGLSLTILSS